MKVTLVEGSDWQGLYIGDVLFRQGHRISAEDLAAAVGVSLRIAYVEDEWLQNRGELPSKFEDVKLV